MAAGPRGRGSWRWFAAWSVLGFGYVWVFLGALSIGPFLLPFVVLGTVLLLRRPAARAGTPAVMAGMGLSLLVVAAINRSGPGVTCTTDSTTQSCSTQWNPLPWLAFGLMLVIFGVGEFVRRQRSMT